MKINFFKPLLLGALTLGLLTSCSDDDSSNSGGGGTSATDISGFVNAGETLNLTAGVKYTLSTTLTVLEGGTLNIAAGTTVTADATGSGNYIAVLKGGTININGEAGNPVILTSENETAGDWGGLTICGNASTTAGTDAQAEVGGFLYGGDEDTDSSGSIEYLILKGAGANINSESQFNGISFYAVGSGTTVNNIAVIDGDDDGVEFFGGTVSATNLYLENNSDDAVDWTEGWSGSVTNVYVSHTVDFSTAIEADGDNGNPTITNFTAVSTVGGTALQFKKASGATMTNVSLTGYDTNLEFANTDQAAEDEVIVDTIGSDDAAFALPSTNATAVDFTTFGLGL